MEPVTLMVGVAVPTAVVALSIAVASYLYYSCWFQQVDIEVATPPVRSLVIMYKFGKGSYNNVTNTLIALNKIAPEEDTVVIYYDDDNKVNLAKIFFVCCSLTKFSYLHYHLLEPWWINTYFLFIQFFNFFHTFWQYLCKTV